MENVWKKLAEWFRSYSEKYASMKSVRGSYEPQVPFALQKTKRNALIESNQF